MIVVETASDQAPQSALPVRRGMYVEDGKEESLKSGKVLGGNRGNDGGFAVYMLK